MKATGMTMRLVLSWPAFVGSHCVQHRYDRDRLAWLRTFRHRRDSTGRVGPIELNDTRRAGKIRAMLAGLLVLVGIGLHSPPGR